MNATGRCKALQNSDLAAMAPPGRVRGHPRRFGVRARGRQLQADQRLLPLEGVEVMWTVVQQGNRHQLGQLVDLGQELGFTNQCSRWR
jgi:hypothetical protein